MPGSPLKLTRLTRKRQKTRLLFASFGIGLSSFLGIHCLAPAEPWRVKVLVALWLQLAFIASCYAERREWGLSSK
ncbi:MAG: hypothetical protein AAGF24_00380 [Cyanobacteria bacterium P01_H01_bin.121]